MPKVRDFLSRHAEFVGGVAVLMSGKTLAAAIAFFTIPIVARLFLPDDFGVAAVFISMVSIMSSVGSLRYGDALVLPEDHSDAVTLFAFTYRVAFTFSALVLLLLLIYEAIGITWSALELLGAWKWYLPIGVLLHTMIFDQDSWLARRKTFKVSSAALVVGNTVTTGIRIGFGAFFGSSIYALMVGYLVGLFSRSAVQQRVALEGLRAAFRHIGWPTMRKFALRYSDFPKLNTPAALLFSTGSNLPILLFGVMFSPAVAGFYAMADRLSQVPIGIVAGSIRQVFLQKAATIRHGGGSLLKAFLLSTGGLALLGAVPFACLWLFGQPVIAWLLGERWSEAGKFLEIIAPWLFMLWVAAPCHPVLIVLRQQRYWLFLEILSILLRIAAFGFAYVTAASPERTLQAFTLVSVVGILATMWTALRMISRHAVDKLSD